MTRGDDEPDTVRPRRPLPLAGEAALTPPPRLPRNRTPPPAPPPPPADPAAPPDSPPRSPSKPNRPRRDGPPKLEPHRSHRCEPCRRPPETPSANRLPPSASPATRRPSTRAEVDPLATGGPEDRRHQDGPRLARQLRLPHAGHHRAGAASTSPTMSPRPSHSTSPMPRSLGAQLENEHAGRHHLRTERRAEIPPMPTT